MKFTIHSDSLVQIDDTKFVYKSNFSQDPARSNSRFPISKPQCNVAIPNELADHLVDIGVDVKMTTPYAGHEEGFVPQAFVQAMANFDSERPPLIYVIKSDKTRQAMQKSTVASIDKMRISRVDATLSIWTNQATGKKSVYIRCMYLWTAMEDDPYAKSLGYGDDPTNQYPIGASEEDPF